jgi:putative DNA primase/helicase
MAAQAVVLSPRQSILVSRPLTESGNAERLQDACGGNIRYSHQQRAWYIWNEHRWLEDRDGEMRRAMLAVIRNLLVAAAHCDDLETRERLVEWEQRCESNHIQVASLACAQNLAGVPIDLAEFDKDPWTLNLKNGVLNLKTLELKEHRREDMLLKMVPHDYEPKATCPLWLKFLGEIFPDKNAETIPFLQRAVGYSLTGWTEEHCLFLLHGTGRNGKSVFIRTLQHLLGEYAMQCDWQSFSIRKHSGLEIREDIARLRGARFVAATESAQNVRLAENLIKSVTGGDRITARHLYQGSFEFQPAFKLWLATNYKPRIVGDDEGIWSRIRLVPFTVTIPEGSRDMKLTEKLQAEAPGILNWAIEGLRMYLTDGLPVPGTVRMATSGYRQDSDQVNRFLDETCIADFRAQILKSVLYERYKNWAEGNGESYVMSKKDFDQSLESRGFQEGSSNRRVTWRGVDLASVERLHDVMR